MKYQMITVMVIVTMVMAAMIGTTWAEKNEAVEFAKAGLEECSDMSWDGRTIWVKDCTAYMEAYQKAKGN